MRKLIILLAVAALGAAVVWAVSPMGRPRACTMIGCEGRVSFRLSTDLRPGVPYTVEACVVDHCRTAALTVPRDRPSGAVDSSESGELRLDSDADIVYLALPDTGSWDGTHQVSLSVLASDGSKVVEVSREADFERLQPNGPDCPPVCWVAEVTV